MDPARAARQGSLGRAPQWGGRTPQGGGHPVGSSARQCCAAEYHGVVVRENSAAAVACSRVALRKPAALPPSMGAPGQQAGKEGGQHGRQRDAKANEEWRVGRQRRRQGRCRCGERRYGGRGRGDVRPHDHWRGRRRHAERRGREASISREPREKGGEGARGGAAAGVSAPVARSAVQFREKRDEKCDDVSRRKRCCDGRGPAACGSEGAKGQHA